MRTLFGLVVVAGSLAVLSCAPVTPPPTTTAPEATPREVWISWDVLNGPGIDATRYPAGATIEVLGVWAGTSTDARACAALGTLGAPAESPEVIPGSDVCGAASPAANASLNLPAVPLREGVTRYAVRPVDYFAERIVSSGLAVIRW